MKTKRPALPAQRSHELIWRSAGIATAAQSEEGDWLVIEFVALDDITRSIDVALPTTELERLRAALDHLAQALADPQSGVRLGPLQ